LKYPVNILIVDDHPVVREGLKHILSREIKIGVFGEAGRYEEALDLAQKQNWDIVVLDINMPGRNGLDVLKELKRLRPELRILILSVCPEDQYAIRSLKLGACGYLMKEGAPKKLARVVSKILKGEKYVSPALAEKLVSYIGSHTEKPLHETLSNREYQIMISLASGKTVKEISLELGLSPKTVETYKGRVLKKMGMERTIELARYSMKNELIDW